MKKRLLSLSKNYSLMLFGPRGVGKSTLVEQHYCAKQSLVINLLDPVEEDRFARHPETLREVVLALPKSIKYVVIDEIQKLPKLLDVVHLLLEAEKCPQHFVLTGSSARKLRAQGVNLLAGRAFVYYMHPFSYLEVGEEFVLDEAMKFGLLPKISSFKRAADKHQYLQAYTLTYLKEEIWAEHAIKKLDPFRKFLEVAAQCNGKVVNYTNIARDVGVEDKTVKNYFGILEDTLVGFVLEPYQHSFRKRLKNAPKFYFFDVGVVRALARMLEVLPKPRTSYYGELFESFIVVECLKLASTLKKDYRFSYLMTGAGVEVDLVVERPGKKTLLIEIKSTDQVQPGSLSSLEMIAEELEGCEAVCFSKDAHKRKIGIVRVYPWREGIKRYFA